MKTKKGISITFTESEVQAVQYALVHTHRALEAEKQHWSLRYDLEQISKRLLDYTLRARVRARKAKTAPHRKRQKKEGKKPSPRENLNG